MRQTFARAFLGAFYIAFLALFVRLVGWRALATVVALCVPFSLALVWAYDD